MKQIALLFLLFGLQSCMNHNNSQISELPIVSSNSILVAEIDGMVCDKGCPKLIKSTIGKWGGINSCSIDYENKQITIEYDSNSIQASKIAEQFKTIGTGTYKLNILSNSSITNKNEDEIIITIPKTKEEREKEKEHISV